MSLPCRPPCTRKHLPTRHDLSSGSVGGKLTQGLALEHRRLSTPCVGGTQRNGSAHARDCRAIQLLDLQTVTRAVTVLPTGTGATNLSVCDR